MSDKATTTTAKTRPTFKEPPRYKLLEKAYFQSVKVHRGRDWVPLSDVLLNPEEQPVVNRLDGPFGGRGDPERVPLEIEYLGIPGDHMEPLNDAARWCLENADVLAAEARKLAATKRKGKGPIESLTIIEPDVQTVATT